MSIGDMGLPLTITDHRQSHCLEIAWEDGSVSRLAHALLRARCRCATCEHLRRNGYPVIGSGDENSIELVGITPVADQGLNLAFSDGHARGIYPWAYLRELAQDTTNTTNTTDAATPESDAENLPAFIADRSL